MHKHNDEVTQQHDKCTCRHQNLFNVECKTSKKTLIFV